MKIVLRINLTQKEVQSYSVLCKEQGHTMEIITETLIQFYLERAAELKKQDDKVSEEAFKKIQQRKF